MGNFGPCSFLPFCRPFSSLFDGKLERTSAGPEGLALALSGVKMGISSGRDRLSLSCFFRDVEEVTEMQRGKELRWKRQITDSKESTQEL